MVIINGEEKKADGMLLSDYVAQNEWKSERIAVEINGVVIPRSEYDITTLNDGDSVEIVSFVGGG